MNLDDPEVPEFASWLSYKSFAWRVRHGMRYVWDKEVQAFLDTVRATLSDRDETLPKGAILFRAQLGIDHANAKDGHGDTVEGVEPVAYGPARMKPTNSHVSEGRTNSAGIAVLYLSSLELTAISEVRPWIGSEVSVARFKTLRPQRMVDLTLGHGKSSEEKILLESPVGEPISSRDKELAVWTDIDSAFSRPTLRSDGSPDYVPTQILAELFRSMNYDGLIYRSNFGESGHNIVLFDLDAAVPISGVPVRVTGVDLKYGEMGNRWHSGKHDC